jgi:hypothetical protein
MVDYSQGIDWAAYARYITRLIVLQLQSLQAQITQQTQQASITEDSQKQPNIAEKETPSE